MYTKCSIKASTDDEGFITHAVIKAPQEHIKIEIKNLEGSVEYLLVWNHLSVFTVIPIEEVDEPGLTADTFDEVFRKPYKGVYKVLGDVEEIIQFLMYRAKRMEETEGLSNAKVMTKISPYDNGMVHRATVTAVNYPIAIDLAENADINVAQIDVDWGDVILNIHAPYSPYFEPLFKEKTVRDLFTNLYTTVTVVLENLKRVIHNYRSRAREAVESVECVTR